MAAIAAMMDVFLTTYGLRNGGIELNPAARRLWELSGLVGLLFGKWLLFMLVYAAQNIPHYRQMLWIVFGVQFFAACWGLVSLLLSIT